MLELTKKGLDRLAGISEDSIWYSSSPLPNWILWQVYEHPGKFSVRTDFVGIDEGTEDEYFFNPEFNRLVLGELIEEGYIEDR